MSQIVAILTEAVSQIVAIQGEDRILLVQQSAVQGPPGPAGASGSGVAVSGGTGTVTSISLIVPSGLVVSGSPITSSGTFTVTYASGIRAYTTAEATKLAGVASGATANSGTVTSIALAMPSGLVVSGSPIVSSGLLAVTYASGVQAYTSAEADKLAGIASGATSSNGTVTSVSLIPPSGLVASGNPIVSSGTITFVYASGFQAYTTAESNKLATIASGAQVNVGTNLSYSGASRALNSSTGSGVILPLFTNSEAGLVGGSGGGTINFLRADGQWAAPPVGSGTSSGTSGGTVTSVGLVVPSGFSVGGSPVTTSGDIALIFASGFSLPSNASQSNWNTAFNERLSWDGGSAGLAAASGRTSLGLTGLATATVGSGLILSSGVLSATTSSVYAVSGWIVPFEGNMAAGSALTANTIALYPFIVRRNVTIDNLGARVTTVTSGSNVQLAVYRSDADNKITGTALAATGSLSSATATTIFGSVTAFTLQAGSIYWMAINSNGTPVMSAPSTLSMHLNSILGPPLLADVFGTATISLVLRTVAQTFNTWPDLTAVTPTVIAGNAAVSKGALVAMQVSALP